MRGFRLGRRALRLRLRRAFVRRTRAPRRQGDRPRRDDTDGSPGAGRIHDHDRRLPRLHVERQDTAGRSGGRDREASRRAPGENRQALRRHERSAARVRAVGCGCLDARDDGFDPEPRSQRRRGRRPRTRDRKRAVRKRFLPALDPDVRRSGRRHRRSTVRAGPDRSEEVDRRLAGRQSVGRRSGRTDRHVPRGVSGGDRSRLPAGPARPARTRGPRGLRLVGLAACQGLPAHL